LTAFVAFCTALAAAETCVPRPWTTVFIDPTVEERLVTELWIDVTVELRLFRLPVIVVREDVIPVREEVIPVRED
jgi:hypothetical protein